MMKKLFLFTLLVSSFLVISCKNNTTNSTSGGWGDYKANGISSIYEGKGYKFFSMDGETYTITIQNGGITGLQQGTLTVNLSKSDIYSVNAEGDTIESLGNNAKVYLIYNCLFHSINCFVNLLLNSFLSILIILKSLYAKILVNHIKLYL